MGRAAVSGLLASGNAAQLLHAKRFAERSMQTHPPQKADEGGGKGDALAIVAEV